MTETEIKEIVQKQRSYFYTGATLPVEKRLDALKKLKTCIQKYEPLINEALKRDLGKSNFESYMCEVGLVLSELSYMIRHTPSYAKEKTVLTPLAQFASRSYKKPSPYGVVLVMSPWNYPFLLTIDPLIDAIAAGNTVVLKPSAYSPHTSRVIETIITECFDPQFAVFILIAVRRKCSVKANDKLFLVGALLAVAAAAAACQRKYHCACCNACHQTCCPVLFHTKNAPFF